MTPALATTPGANGRSNAVSAGAEGYNFPLNRGYGV